MPTFTCLIRRLRLWCRRPVQRVDARTRFICKRRSPAGGSFSNGTAPTATLSGQCAVERKSQRPCQNPKRKAAGPITSQMEAISGPTNRARRFPTISRVPRLIQVRGGGAWSLKRHSGSQARAATIQCFSSCSFRGRWDSVESRCQPARHSRRASVYPCCFVKH